MRDLVLLRATEDSDRGLELTVGSRESLSCGRTEVGGP